MGTPLLVRQAQIAGKVETTPGSMETLAAAQATCRVYTGVGVEPNIAMEPRPIARGTLSMLGSLPGEKQGTINFRSEMNTSDTVTADLEIKPFLEACAFTIIDAKAITVGTPQTAYLRGETITDESAATGRVIKELSAAGFLYHEPVTGTLSTGETITGGTSGATATSSSAAETRGHSVLPISDNQKPISAAYYEDGFWWALTGAMGNLTMVMESSKAGFFDVSLNGPKHGFGDKALLSSITYQTEQPPVLQGANLTINGVTVVATAINIDMGHTVVNRPDLNAGTTGFIAAYISGKDPKMTISMEQLPEATLDVEGLRAAGTEMAVLFQLGTAQGKTIWVFADNSQIINVSPGDNDGIRTVDIEFSLNGDANDEDDEIELLFI